MPATPFPQRNGRTPITLTADWDEGSETLRFRQKIFRETAHAWTVAKARRFLVASALSTPSTPVVRCLLGQVGTHPLRPQPQAILDEQIKNARSGGRCILAIHSGFPKVGLRPEGLGLDPGPLTRVAAHTHGHRTAGVNALAYTNSSVTTRCFSTPVSRWSSPWNLNVNRSWSIPRQCRIVAFRSLM